MSMFFDSYITTLQLHPLQINMVDKVEKVETYNHYLALCIK